MLNGGFVEVDRLAKGEKTDKGKAKESESQRGPKQTTLFGLPAAALDSSVKKSSAPSKSDSSKATGTEDETQETQNETTKSQATTTCDVQGNEETQETQVLDQAPPQEMNDDEEPIEWPDSPPPQSEVE